MARVALKTPALVYPSQGDRELPVTYDFTVATSISEDLSPEAQASQIELVQSVFVDNSANANALTITFLQTGIVIIVPPASQGVYPVIEPTPMKCTLATTGGVRVTVAWSNIARSPGVWPVGPINSLVSGSYVNRSGTIAVANTSQVLMAANANRRGFVIQNPGSAAAQGIGAAENLYINFGAVAHVNSGLNTDSIELVPGGSYVSGNGPVPVQVINVIALTINHAYIAKEI